MIVVNLVVMLARRKVSVTELSEKLGLPWQMFLF